MAPRTLLAGTPHWEAALPYTSIMTPEFFQITGGLGGGETPLTLHVPFWVLPALFLPEYFHTAFNKVHFAQMHLMFQVIQITWCPCCYQTTTFISVWGLWKDLTCEGFLSTSKSLVGVRSSSQPGIGSYSACQKCPIHWSFPESYLYKFILALVKINKPNVFNGFKNKPSIIGVLTLHN